MASPTLLEVRREGVRIDNTTPGRVRLALTVLSEFLAVSNRVTSVTPRRDTSLRPGVVYKVNTGVLPTSPAGVRPVDTLPWRASAEAWAFGTEVKRVELSAENGELVIYFTVALEVPQNAVPYWFETIIGEFVIPDSAPADRAPTERLIGQPPIADRFVPCAEPTAQPQTAQSQMTASQKAVGVRAWLNTPTAPKN